MSNRLASEKSPYLLQHKDNPVDWWPWGSAAFEAASKANRPIFLSIGYATCHWCHVMEKESFEDQEVARLLNETFINIKVDREERPDVDAIYMSACQIATGRGGWPLSIMMTPAMRPFFAGTYLPKTTRYGHEGMLQIIPKVAKAWQKYRHHFETTADEFEQALNKSANLDFSGEEISEDILHGAFQHFHQQYDPLHGGFGSAPKFPTPERLRFLLRYWHRTGNPQALDIVEHTLQNMRRGGIFDQLGGGFHRYSTDSNWRVPHFEKMLYDQALLILIYLEAFQITGKQEYSQTVHEALRYVLRDLQTTEDAYCTGEDADSEGVEGKYYLWDMKELNSLLKPKEIKSFTKIFNLDQKGNYLDESTQRKTGSNILYLSAQDELSDEPPFLAIVDRLLKHRNQRVRPLLDDKVLTDWNGLMITALARCGMVFGDPVWIDHAERCVQFIIKHLLSGPDRLLHRWREGEAIIEGLLDDYAYMIMGLLTLFEATGKQSYCNLALSLTKTVIADFECEEGGFYMVSSESNQLLLRPKQAFDSAIPSGNSIMILNLIRLGRLTGDPELEAVGHQSIDACSGGLKSYPDGFCASLSALDYALGPSTEIIISGDPDHPETRTALTSLRKVYAPNTAVLSRPDFGGSNAFEIHLCQGKTCEPPTQNVQDVIHRITRPVHQRPAHE